MSATVTEPVVAPRLSRKFRLQWEDAQHAWVLLYPEGMVRLNQSAGEILSRCNGERTLTELVADLEQTFDTTGLQADVVAFLRMARQQLWIEY